MITCRQVQQLHDACLDAELSVALTAEVHAHLLQCPECQQQAQMLRACEDVIARDRSEPAVMSDFADRVLAALPAQPAIATAPLKLPGAASKAPALETRRQRRYRVAAKIVRASLPAVAAVLFMSVLIWPPKAVEVRPTMVLPAVVWAADAKPQVMDTVEETTHAAKVLNDIARESFSEAQEQVRMKADAVAEMPAPVRQAPPQFVAPLDFLLELPGEMLQPAEPQEAPDADVVRF